MITPGEYIRQSLGLHLCFDRITLEHGFFIASSLPPPNQALADQANGYKVQFEALLAQTVPLANGVVSPGMLLSGQVVTPYTLNAELLTQFYTGTTFNTALTQAEGQLVGAPAAYDSPELEWQVRMLNAQAIQWVAAFIQFKKNILSDVLQCRMFTSNYPLLIQKLILEEEFYLDMLNRLETRREMEGGPRAMEVAAYWNGIMGGHAKFIRGLLDPTEDARIETANRFGIWFDTLVAEAEAAADAVEAQETVLLESMRATEALRDFKANSTAGILGCEIRSILIPLAADHILREANFYLRILGEYEESERKI